MSNYDSVMEEVRVRDESIRIRREALALVHPENHLDKSLQLHLLSNHLGDRFLETEDFNDLEEAIDLGKEALNLTPVEDHSRRGEYLKRLKLLFEDKYEETEDVVDFDEIVQYQRLMLESTSPGNIDLLTTRMAALGALLDRRSSITGHVSDLDESIQITRCVLEMKPGNKRAMKSLMHTLYDRYRQTGQISDIEECIRLHRQTNDSPITDQSKVEWILTIARYLCILHERTEEEAYLEEAFAMANKALEIIPKDHWESMWLHVLARMFGCQYLKTEALTDINEAIGLERLALKAKPAEEHRSGILTNLGNRLGDKYLRTESEDDINEAIKCAREALELDPEDHSGFYNIAIKLGDRFTRMNDLKDINEAIELERQALERISLEHPERVDYLNALGNQLEDRFKHTRNFLDLEEAIQIAERVLELMLENHPHRAARLNGLAGRFLDLYNIKGSETDFNKAIARYQLALNHEASAAEDRIEAGQAIISHCPDTQRVYDAARIAVGLVPKLVLWSHENHDRQFILGRVVGLASDAAAAALQAGESPMTALKLLEQGRGIIGSSLQDMRIDVQDLEKDFPHLAEQYRNLQTKLDQSNTIKTTSKKLQASINQKHSSSRKFKELTSDIRQLPGYETFMLPHNDDEIYKASECGPIVVINVSRLRCDALLVSDSRVQTLALCGLTFEELEYQIRVRSLASPQTLEWLWDTIASPVLGVLGFTETPPSNKWPRIWWIPTSPLIQMPLHAAGYHDQGGSESVLDRVLSSYGSSIRNIIRGRREAVQASVPDQALLVAMEHTLGHDSLSFAAKEIDAVTGIIESMKITPIIPERTKKYITQYLPECQIFHFAGHGLANVDDSLQSCLLLEDWETDTLKVSDIFDMDFRKGAPFLAYLSACGTGQIKNETSFDENINLIGACQIAGFRHVIGTLWSVQDEMSVRMATMTYQELKDSEISDNSICRGLHKATCELRGDWLERRISHQSVASSTVTNCHEITIEFHGGSVRDASLIDCRDQNLGLAYWAPYVHYGV